MSKEIEQIEKEILAVKDWCIANRNCSPSFNIICRYRKFLGENCQNLSIVEATILFVVKTVEEEGRLGDLVFRACGVHYWKDLASIIESLEANKHATLTEKDKKDIEDLSELDKRQPFQAYIEYTADKYDRKSISYPKNSV